MKKQKRVTESPDERSSSDLYQTVISLDKSDENAVSLLDSVFELLHVDDHDIAFPGPTLGADSDISVRPTSKWALRWLLRRLAIRAESALDLGLHYRAWMLFNYLVRVIPYSAVNQLLRAHDFLDTVAGVLQKLSQYDCKSVVADPASQEWKMFLRNRDYFKINLEGIPETETVSKPQRKRKRTTIELDKLSQSSLGRCFYYIAETLQFLQRATSQYRGEKRRVWERAAILEAKPKQCIRILASGLVVFAHVLRSQCLEDLHSKRLSKTELIQPFIQLYGNSCNKVVDGNDAQLSGMALEECSVPVVLVLNEYDTLKKSSSDLSMQPRFVSQVQNLLAQTTIHPFRAWFQASEKRAKNHSAAQSIDGDDRDLCAKFQELFGSENHLLEVAPLFEAAFDCARRDTPLQRSREDPWLQELFSTLFQLRPCNRLLEIANSRNLVLSSKHLSLLVNSCDNKGDTEFLQLCIANNPTSFTSSHIDAVPAMTEIVFKFASTFNGAVLQPQTVRRSDVKPSNHSYDLVLNSICLPLLEAFAANRDMESFLLLWSRYLEQGATVYEHGPMEYLNCSIWTDDRLLAKLALHLSESISSTRRLELLRVWTETMDETDGDITEQQSVILVGCIIAGVRGHEMKALRSSAMPTAISNIIWRRLEKGSATDSESVIHRTPSWRYWRILFDLVDTGSLTIAKPTSLAEAQGIKHTTKLLRKQLNHFEKPISIRETAEAFFAWTYLVRVLSLLDPAAEDPEAIKFVQTPWAKITAEKLHSPTETTEVPYSDHVVLKSRRWLVMECLLYVLDAAIGSNWLNTIFTPEILRVVQYSAYDDMNGSWSHHNLEATNHGELVLTWPYLWFRLCRASENCRNSALKHRIQTLKIRAIQNLPQPNSESLERYQIVLKDTFDLRSSMIEKKNRAQIVGLLKQWLDSGLLKTARAVFFETHTLLHRLDNESNPCSECKVSKDVVTYRRLSTHEAQAHRHTLGRIQTVLAQLRKNQHSDNTATTFKATFWELQQTMQTCKDPAIFVAISKTIYVLLKARQLPLVGQVQVDELFAMISHVTSTKCVLAADTADNIYLCLCRLFGALLSDYRHRINGRFHLVLAALKGLLWCLFEPQQDYQVPGWLDSNSKPPSPRCAEEFSRLLTGLSDPTISAARVGNKKSRLNDPTKKARSIAGQHLSQLIFSFCSFQLRGRLDPLLRAKINPGLWAIMDSMSQDVMQNMNAAMGPSERSVFKIMYDDWRKFGRWRGS